MKTPPPSRSRRRFVTLLIALCSSCNMVFGMALVTVTHETPELEKSSGEDSLERLMSRDFKILSSAADSDVFHHPALRNLITLLRGNLSDTRSGDVVDDSGSSVVVKKRSPLSVGFVSGLGEDQQRSHAVVLSAASGPHVISAVAKSGTSTQHGSGHGPNHLGLDADTTLLVHHPGSEITAPIVLHEEIPHLTVPLHEVPKVPAISVVHQEVDAKVLPTDVKTATVSVTHHPVAPQIQPLILNPGPAAIVVVPHIDLTHPVTHISAPPPEASSDSFRDHIGGYGVGVNFGGAGAGHGYYAG